MKPISSNLTAGPFCLAIKHPFCPDVFGFVAQHKKAQGRARNRVSLLPGMT